MFLKAPSSVIGTGETILMPHGRTELDWEIELGTVIGRRARYVAARRPRIMSSATPSCSTSRIAAGGRRADRRRHRLVPDEGPGHVRPDGSVHRAEGVLRRPDDDLKQTLLVGTDQRQAADSSDMIHSVWEVIGPPRRSSRCSRVTSSAPARQAASAWGRRFAVRRCGWCW